MTVSTSEARVKYDGSGTTGPFTIPWYFLRNEDLLVIITDENEVETTLALTTGFTATGAGDQDGGTLTTVAGVPVGSSITIIREPDLLQQTDYPDRGPFPAASHERALDKLTMQIQRIYDKMTRFLRVAETSTGTTEIDIATLVNAANLAAAAVSAAEAAALAAAAAAASLDTSNFATKTGGNATGTWGIDISGTAAKIGGVSLSALVRSVNGNAPDGGGNVAVNAASVGAVAKTGDAMSGNLTISNSSPYLALEDTTTGRIIIVNHDADIVGFYEAGTGWKMYVTDGGNIWTPALGFITDYFAAAGHTHDYSASFVAKGMAALAVGMIAYCQYTNSTGLTVNNTTSGSNLTIGGSVISSGTWKNIGPATVNQNGEGMFQRTA